MPLNNIKAAIGFAHDRWRMRRDPIEYARSIGVTIGNECRLVSLSHVTFGSEPYLVRLGDHVTVTGGVRFVTHDGGVWIFRKQFPDIELFQPIVVEDNVFIGANSIILPGVTIERDCVIGAGSVVTKAIPAGTVAVGCPARPIKTKEDYWKSIVLHATYTRALPKAEKRQLLTERLTSSNNSLKADQQLLNTALPEINLPANQPETSAATKESIEIPVLSSDGTD